MELGQLEVDARILEARSRPSIGYLEAAYHAVVWNGRNAAGIEVPSGIYIARLTTPEFTKSIKMALLK